MWEPSKHSLKAMHHSYETLPKLPKIVLIFSIIFVLFLYMPLPDWKHTENREVAYNSTYLTVL